MDISLAVKAPSLLEEAGLETINLTRCGRKCWHVGYIWSVMELAGISSCKIKREPRRGNECY